MKGDHMTQWEYRAIVMVTSDALPTLEALGREGWELGGIEPDPVIAGGAATFWLKRPRPAPTVTLAPRGLYARGVVANDPQREWGA